MSLSCNSRLISTLGSSSTTISTCAWSEDGEGGSECGGGDGDGGSEGGGAESEGGGGGGGRLELGLLSFLSNVFSSNVGSEPAKAEPPGVKRPVYACLREIVLVLAISLSMTVVPDFVSDMGVNSWLELY
jgi:hypothetical protein